MVGQLLTFSHSNTSALQPLPGYMQQPVVNSVAETEPQCQLGMIVTMKQEPMDEARNDSGINSGSDCRSVSPGSDRSMDSLPQTPQNHDRTISNQNQFANRMLPDPSWYNNHFLASPTNSKGRDAAQNGDHNSQSPKLDSGDETAEYDDQGIRIPKVNSHGKIKVHKCKQCDFVAYTKLDFWEHSKTHIKGDKILKCPRCPFVTEYKHHLEYHLLNHAGAKPFKCDHCEYTCVNKSMLNSHLKSHSKVYQYRCADCLYETKYCHSLKLHLRKYNHKPAMVLNPDGSPNPLPIIDVYGTRRGPKVKKQQSTSPYPESLSPKLEPPLPFNPLVAPLLTQNQLPFPFPFVGGFSGPMPNLTNPEFVENVQRLFRQRIEEFAKQQGSGSNENGVLDLSKPNDHSSEDESESTTVFGNVEVVSDVRDADSLDKTLKEESEDRNVENNNKYDFACQYCGICFDDEVLFRIHMGYHGYSNAFTCNMCGEECKDKVTFFLHIARAAH
ncbi:protein hunchback-like [Cylas formicarius]|uniref:protein hunchback-like n=1 Tax=Cylas formicarius TaxID=197179 RepID=UPI0029583291|nr:protein hunchback-like [Cylas formicarius]